MEDIPLFFTPSPENSLPQLRAKFSSLYHEYQVVLEIEKNKQKTTLQYQAGVKYQKSSGTNAPIISIQKLTKTFINKVEPDTLTEQISELAGSIFQPLWVEISPRGEISQLINYQSILSKWEEVKEELLKNYAGSVINSYIQHINNTINTSDLLLEKLKNDWFLSLYTVPIYSTYSTPAEKEKWIFPSLLKGVDKKEYSLTKRSENPNDTQNSPLVLIESIDKPEEFSAIYTLDSQTKLIKKIEVVIIEEQGYSLKAEIEVLKIHKKEKTESTLPKANKASFNEEKEWQKYLRKKKGFFGRLFE
ncbi:hypothetical protein ETU10_11050 [Apibacter muscae]|uniref:hypothetical protein n=1 Tax=Apibacter muscae TaxID=2509004 RepID=UPI0011AD8554|nr:hypothetical protein [Apibacter muscae]TWP22477.1 hypothetical protein ETU10_11050 [Apibacter muscae]